MKTATAVENYIKKHWEKTVRRVTEDHGTLLGMPYPYTVPCQKGVMQNNFYWDTYFTNLGLLGHGLMDLAKSNVDNLLWEVEKYGFVPNGNLIFFLNRSQTPFLSMMVWDIFEKIQDKIWLKNAVEILKKEYQFWQEQRTTPNGLNRHFHHANPDEVLNFYRDVVEPRLGISTTDETEQMQLGEHHLAEAETGWDFDPRFTLHCADFNAIDLNSLLFLYETNFAKFSQILDEPDAELWLALAARRRSLVTEFCWNDRVGLFYDFDFKNQTKSTIASLASFVPLWTGLASPEQARTTVKNLTRFEYEYGVSSCEKNANRFIYQWDYPNGWPPLFEMTVKGLARYGFIEDARRIAQKYVKLVVHNYDTTGDLWEKYNVVIGTTQVKNEYDMPAMLGWTAGVFVSLLTFLRESKSY
jgi:alpha,alpha-trehalase